MVHQVNRIRAQCLARHKPATSGMDEPYQGLRNENLSLPGVSTSGYFCNRLDDNDNDGIDEDKSLQASPYQWQKGKRKRDIFEHFLPTHYPFIHNSCLCSSSSRESKDTDVPIIQSRKSYQEASNAGSPSTKPFYYWWPVVLPSSHWSLYNDPFVFFFSSLYKIRMGVNILTIETQCVYVGWEH